MHLRLFLSLHLLPLYSSSYLSCYSFYLCPCLSVISLFPHLLPFCLPPSALSALVILHFLSVSPLLHLQLLLSSHSSLLFMSFSPLLLCHLCSVVFLLSFSSLSFSAKSSPFPFPVLLSNPPLSLCSPSGILSSCFCPPVFLNSSFVSYFPPFCLFSLLCYFFCISE